MKQTGNPVQIRDGCHQMGGSLGFPEFRAWLLSDRRNMRKISLRFSPVVWRHGEGRKSYRARAGILVAPIQEKTLKPGEDARRV
ncbi:MAG: hypothetical protein DIKNOCCD_02722 [bacterium]|nr:hypothetical protein [bacterium]